MKDDDSAEVASMLLSLKVPSIEKVFTECVTDIKQILVLDGIDLLPDGFRVRSYDLHGQLPEIIIENSGDTFRDKDRLGRETLLAIVELRDQIVTWLRRGRFLPPTSIDGKAVVGLHARPKTWIIEERDFLAAYHELYSQSVG